MSDDTNLPVLSPGGAIPAPQEWTIIERICDTVANSGVVPPAYRGKRADVMAAVLYGRELGLAPMTALQSIHMIEGRPSLSAVAQLGLVRRLGHEVVPTEQSTTVASCKARRAGTEEWSVFSFTWADAEAARLTNKDNWKKYPAAMLWARCATLCCRALFSDVLMGVAYEPDELGVDVDPITGEPVGAAATITPAAALALRARIMALPDDQRSALALEMRGRHLVLADFKADPPVPRLAAFRSAEVEGLIDQYEQDAAVAGPRVAGPSADGDAGGTGVGFAGSSPAGVVGSTPSDGIEDAVVVAEGGPDNDGPPASGGGGHASAAAPSVPSPPEPVVPVDPADPDAPSSAAQRQQIAVMAKDLGWDDDQRRLFVQQITRGRAQGASSCTFGDARLVRSALSHVAAKSLRVEWGEAEGGGWECLIGGGTKPAMSWYNKRP